MRDSKHIGHSFLLLIAGGLTTFLLWRTLISFMGPVNLLVAFPCSIVGGYLAGRLRTNGIPSGAVSGIVAGFIMVIYVAESFGDWPLYYVWRHNDDSMDYWRRIRRINIQYR